MRKILLLIITSLVLIANGEELYKTCVGCHGENGEITALGQSRIITGQENNLTIKQLTAYKNGELNQYGLGNIMQLQLTTLNDENINELAKYISNMQSNESTNK